MGHPQLRPEEWNGDEFQIAVIRAIVAASPDAILVVDEHGVIVTHKQRLLDLISVRNDDLRGARGGSLEGVLGEHVLAQVVGQVKAPEAFLARLKELCTHPTLDHHSEIEMFNGTTIECHSTGLWNQAGHYLGRVLFFRDITPHKQTEAALRQLAQTDPLTGVANRRQFFVRAHEEFVRAKRFGRPLSFVMVDIDRFKPINDKWGHATGDDVLKTLCTAWKKVIRQMDLFARLGGEEFAVVLTETDVQQAHVVAEKLRQIATEQTVRRNGEDIRCTISVGVSTVVPEDATAEDSVRRADSALYRAKEQGRNRTEESP